MSMTRSFGASVLTLSAAYFLLSCTSHRVQDPEIQVHESTAEREGAESSNQPGTFDIVKPRNEAIEHIKERCKEDYVIVSERVETAEVGISTPIGTSESRAKPRWFIRYRCSGATP